MTRIAVDAMGGDHAPQAVVEGAVAAAHRLDSELLLVGPEATVRAELAARGRAAESVAGRIQVVHAPEQISMEEHPVEAVRKKRGSSLVVAARLVREGKADALVSAGSTGGVLASALLHVGRVHGVDRPALALVFPLFSGPVVLIDGGANVDCRPSHLLDFAILGRAFAECALGLEKPRVGLLSVGEEPTKGNEVVLEAHARLREHVRGFVGNVEGKDIFAGAADVVVCDGFVGNVLLKSVEGFASSLLGEIRRAATSGVRGRLGGLLLRPALMRLRQRFDYRTYGGALLAGVNGVVVVAHGRSDARAIESAVTFADRLVREQLVPAVTRAIEAVHGKGHENAGP